MKGNVGGSGTYNVAIGINALCCVSSAGCSIAIGTDSLRQNTVGILNTVIGYQAGYGNLSGSRNVFIGACAGYVETGSDMLYIANSGSTAFLVKGCFLNNTICNGGNTTACDSCSRI